MYLPCKILLSVFIVFTLYGCQDTTSSSEENNATSLEAGNDIPVLSITTNNSSADALDFVTKPVAGFVAEQIASWTPNYEMPPAPYYEDCKITVTDVDGTITLSNIDAQVKVRGNWTTTYAKKLTFEVPWDFDSAMGNKDRCADGTGFYAANIVWDVNHRLRLRRL